MDSGQNPMVSTARNRSTSFCPMDGAETFAAPAKASCVSKIAPNLQQELSDEVESKQEDTQQANSTVTASVELVTKPAAMVTSPLPVLSERTSGKILEILQPEDEEEKNHGFMSSEDSLPTLAASIHPVFTADEAASVSLKRPSNAPDPAETAQGVVTGESHSKMPKADHGCTAADRFDLEEKEECEVDT